MSHWFTGLKLLELGSGADPGRQCSWTLREKPNETEELFVSPIPGRDDASYKSISDDTEDTSLRQPWYMSFRPQPLVEVTSLPSSLLLKPFVEQSEVDFENEDYDSDDGPFLSEYKRVMQVLGRRPHSGISANLDELDRLLKDLEDEARSTRMAEASALVKGSLLGALGAFSPGEHGPGSPINDDDANKKLPPKQELPIDESGGLVIDLADTFCRDVGALPVLFILWDTTYAITVVDLCGCGLTNTTIQALHTFMVDNRVDPSSPTRVLFSSPLVAGERHNHQANGTISGDDAARLPITTSGTDQMPERGALCSTPQRAAPSDTGQPGLSDAEELLSSIVPAYRDGSCWCPALKKLYLDNNPALTAAAAVMLVEMAVVRPALTTISLSGVPWILGTPQHLRLTQVLMLNSLPVDPKMGQQGDRRSSK